MTAGSAPTRLLSIPAAAEQLACSRGHVYGLIAAGHLKAVEIKAKGTRSKTRVLAAEVEAFITDRTRSTRTRQDGGGNAKPVT